MVVIVELVGFGVDMKLIMGDNRVVIVYAVLVVGFDAIRLLVSDEIVRFGVVEVDVVVGDMVVFVEIDLLYREVVVVALCCMGCMVGYFGDGINDVLLLRSVDVGILVDMVVDIVCYIVSIVLLDKDLVVFVEGIC